MEDIEMEPAEMLQPYVTGPNAVDVSPCNDRGVLKEIIQEGTGTETPGTGSKTSVHYVGTLTDGTKFDSSRDRGTPFEFDLGQGSVIKAWDIGVATMKKGEIAVFTCTSEYAYGATGSPPKIPPNATLIFEIELLSWEGEDLSPRKDKSVVKHILIKGEGFNSPNDGTQAKVHLVGMHNDRVFEDRELTFPIGEGSEYGICKGLELALEKFKRGEKSRIELKAEYAFGAEGNAELQIPANADIVYIAHMKSFDRMKESWDMDCNEKLEQSRVFKEKGTNYFKAGKFELAIRMYKKILDLLDFDAGFEKEPESAARKELMTQGRLNIALCHLKVGDNINARDVCTRVLETEPTNEKGLFRRGQAYLNLSEPELAKKDFETILQHEPNNKAAANQVKICQQKLKEQLSREKQIYANMFEKFAKIDRQGS